jgi:hypothetical protein
LVLLSLKKLSIIDSNTPIPAHLTIPAYCCLTNKYHGNHITDFLFGRPLASDEGKGEKLVQA